MLGIPKMQHRKNQPELKPWIRNDQSHCWNNSTSLLNQRSINGGYISPVAKPRRFMVNSRFEPLPEYSSFDHRAQDPISHRPPPKMTLNQEASTMIITRSKSPLPRSIVPAKLCKDYKGFTSTGRAYQNRDVRSQLEEQYRSQYEQRTYLSPGTYHSKANALRETVELEYYHSGVY